MLHLGQEDKGLWEEGTSVETRDGGAIHGKGHLVWSLRSKGPRTHPRSFETGALRSQAHIRNKSEGEEQPKGNGRAGTGAPGRMDVLGTDGLGLPVTFLGPVSGSGHFAASGPLVSPGDPVRTPGS